MHIPLATYRVQLNKDFGFREAKEIVPYLAELGISHFYASPIFKARKGSMHGYDIIDPRQINPELEEYKDFEELGENLRKYGLLWLQDIIPNHMAFDSQNSMLMDILENGEDSRYFQFFDIDWNHPYESLKGKLLTPFLGKFYAEALEKGEIKLHYDETGLSINYYALRLPLKVDSYSQVFEHNLESLQQKLGANNPDFIKFLGQIHFLKAMFLKKNTGPLFEQITHAKKMLWNLYTSNQEIKKFMDENINFFNGQTQNFDALDKLISEQLFRLSFWKVATEEINYRRFFTVNELISLRMEDETVFNFTHDLIFKLVREAKFHGIRVDHIDGLYDPTTYLKRLRQKLGDIYIVVEKILGVNEEFPSFWPVEGTTGYDFMNYVNGIFCKKDNENEFSKIYYKFTGLHTSYEELVCEKKRLIIGKHLAGNIDNLAQLLKKISNKDRYGRDLTLYGLKRALVEIMANFPIYRTYINEEIYCENDQGYIKEAIQKAKQSLPGFLYELNFIEKFLLFVSNESLSDEEKKQRIHFVMNFQQYTAPLMAKGFEDTVLYIYNKLVSLNEVGNNPNKFGFSVEEFHDFNKKRIEILATSLNTTSTHDTKRGEDVRVRIDVLSEIPKEWESQLETWSRINRSKKKKVNDRYYPDENDEYFLYQNLIGAFPFAEEEMPVFKERMKNYVVKAVREAKVHTAWIKPDTEYEDACIQFIEEILRFSEDNRFLNELLPFQRKIAHYGIFNALSQILLKIASPGIPDFYQGTELWDLNLVDPDNRRPVDFQKRMAWLSEVKQKEQQDILGLIKELISSKEDGRIKMFLIYKALQIRKEKHILFQKGEYIPLESQGKFKDNIIAFARKYDRDWVLTIAPRFYTSLVKEGEFPLGEKVWSDTHILLSKETPFSWRNVITGENLSSSEKLLLKDLLENFPVALLTNMQ